jgi:hypothetical protein
VSFHLAKNLGRFIVVNPPEPCLRKNELNEVCTEKRDECDEADVLRYTLKRFQGFEPNKWVLWVNTGTVCVDGEYSSPRKLTRAVVLNSANILF